MIYWHVIVPDKKIGKWIRRRGGEIEVEVFPPPDRIVAMIYTEKLARQIGNRWKLEVIKHDYTILDGY